MFSSLNRTTLAREKTCEALHHLTLFTVRSIEMNGLHCSAWRDPDQGSSITELTWDTITLNII